jgi:tetratricopeptide (TPR) repeat protein
VAERRAACYRAVSHDGGGGTPAQWARFGRETTGCPGEGQAGGAASDRLGSGTEGDPGLCRTGAVVQAFERAKTLCMDLADDELLLDVLPGLQGYYHVHGPLRSALELGEQLVTLARGRPEEPHRLLDARRRMGWSLFWAGEIAQAGNYLESALALYDLKDHQLYRKLYGDHPGVFSHCNLAWVRWSQGRTGEADRHANAALKLTEKMGHVLSLAYSTCMIGALYAVQQEYVAAKRLAGDPLGGRQRFSLLDGLGAYHPRLGAVPLG